MADLPPLALIAAELPFGTALSFQQTRHGLPTQPRGHLALEAENDGLAPWCGPAALALATGYHYGAATELLRRSAPAWYPDNGPIIVAYWRDLLMALGQAGVAYTVIQPTPDHPRNSLSRLVRSGLAPGWYLLRVTDHFLLVRSYGFGLTTVHDNRHSGTVLSAHCHGRRKVTHVARLRSGPLVKR